MVVLRTHKVNNRKMVTWHCSKTGCNEHGTCQPSSLERRVKPVLCQKHSRERARFNDTLSPRWG